MARTLAASLCYVGAVRRPCSGASCLVDVLAWCSRTFISRLFSRSVFFGGRFIARGHHAVLADYLARSLFQRPTSPVGEQLRAAYGAARSLLNQVFLYEVHGRKKELAVIAWVNSKNPEGTKPQRCECGAPAEAWVRANKKTSLRCLRCPEVRSYNRDGRDRSEIRKTLKFLSDDKLTLP